MKRILFSLFLFFYFTNIFSQNNLFKILQDENGVSKHYVQIPLESQVTFNPSNARNIFGLDPNSDLKLYGTKKDDLGFTHYRYYQTYNDVRIESSMLVAHVKNGKLVSVNSCIVTDFENSMKSRFSIKVSERDAVQKAIKHVNGSVFMWQDKEMEKLLKEQTNNVFATYYPTTEKAWFASANSIEPKSLRLAYKIDVFAKEPYSRAYYFIDAITGEIIGSKQRILASDVIGTANTLYSGQQTITSDMVTTSKYRLRDYSRGNGVVTVHGELLKRGKDYLNGTQNWNFNLPDRNSLDVHWGVEKTYDFYKQRFGRNSLDDKGYPLYSYVNITPIFKDYWDNASWNGTLMSYGISQSGIGVTTIDITGHELTHGVTQFTCGLNYEGESGAINESLSDIMGKSIQFSAKPSDIDWRLGNDMKDQNLIHRDMSNPSFYYQADTYKDSFWVSTDGCIPDIKLNDNCGVHWNSGIGNYMFYLLVIGKSGTNDNGRTYKVQGIGIKKADSIIYRSQAFYLVPISNYPNWRTDCIAAATDLYGLSSNEVQQVKNAFDAIGVYDNKQVFIMNSTAVSTCSGVYYDPGGTGQYLNNMDVIQTFTPCTSGAVLRFNFSDFNLENGHDFLTVYNGPDINSPLIGSYTGLTSPGAIQANNPSGQITFHFKSDNSNTYTGWVASIYCADSTKTLYIRAPITYEGFKLAIEGSVSDNNKLVDIGAVTGNVVLYRDDLFDSSTGCSLAINAAQLKGKIALIDRGSCAFTVKYKKAQEAGAIAVIVGNVAPDDPRYTTGRGNALLSMSGSDNTITIPGVFIGYDDSQKMKGFINGGTNVNATLLPANCQQIDVQPRIYISKKSFDVGKPQITRNFLDDLDSKAKDTRVIIRR